MKGLSWANFALGVWLVIAPFALMYRGIQAAFWEDLVVGFLIAVFSLWHAISTEAEESAVENWIVGALGLWALGSPLALHFSGAITAMRNNVIVGFTVTLLTIFLVLSSRHHHYPSP